MEVEVEVEVEGRVDYSFRCSLQKREGGQRDVVQLGLGCTAIVSRKGTRITGFPTERTPVQEMTSPSLHGGLEGPLRQISLRLPRRLPWCQTASPPLANRYSSGLLRHILDTSSSCLWLNPWPLTVRTRGKKKICTRESPVGGNFRKR